MRDKYMAFLFFAGKCRKTSHVYEYLNGLKRMSNMVFQFLNSLFFPEINVLYWAVNTSDQTIKKGV